MDRVDCEVIRPDVHIELREATSYPIAFTVEDVDLTPMLRYPVARTAFTLIH